MKNLMILEVKAGALQRYTETDENLEAEVRIWAQEAAMSRIMECGSKVIAHMTTNFERDLRSGMFKSRVTVHYWSPGVTRPMPAETQAFLRDSEGGWGRTDARLL